MMWTWKQLKAILKKQEDYTSTAVVVWNVSPDSVVGVDEPHSTVIYLGDIATLNRQDVMDAIKETAHDMMVPVKDAGIEYFGPENDIKVLRIEHPYLYKYYDFITSALNKRGIYSASEFDYSPHITLGDTGTNMSDTIVIGPIQLWWGDEKISDL